MLGIFQHVWLTKFPAVCPRTHLVLRGRGRRTEIGGHTIRIRFVDEAGAELLGGEGTVQFGEPPAGVTDVEAGAVFTHPSGKEISHVIACTVPVADEPGDDDPEEPGEPTDPKDPEEPKDPEKPGDDDKPEGPGKPGDDDKGKDKPVKPVKPGLPKTGR